MDPLTASRTALATSLMRALHARTDTHRILDDSWGDQLVPPEARALVYQMIRNHMPELPATPDAATQQRAIDASLRANAGYPNVLMRSRFTEDALSRAVTRGVRQYVLIGAGFDSYALRRAQDAAGVTVIEIDHPATQAFKRHCMAASGIVAPEPVHYISADLANEDLEAVLRASPLRVSEPTFFAWLGVTMYLTREANLATLRAVSTVAAPDSEVVFSYIDQAFFGGPNEDTTDKTNELRAMVASVGEPFVSGFHPESLTAELGPIGYELIEECSDLELLRRYDPAGANGLVVHNELSRIAHLRVATKQTR
ncbi:MAG: class I SAM-dependent methyltransferase [Sinobacteraceae bacterium]|nr:class I SAM-dependent methyltransferase [Nevskiaceae bacterium]